MGHKLLHIHPSHLSVSSLGLSSGLALCATTFTAFIAGIIPPGLLLSGGTGLLVAGEGCVGLELSFTGTTQVQVLILTGLIIHRDRRGLGQGRSYLLSTFMPVLTLTEVCV